MGGDVDQPMQVPEAATPRVVGSPPSGEQHVIRRGGHHAIVTEVGATLRSYAIGGLDVLDGFEVTELARDGRGQVLAPWPNRLDGGSYAFEGRRGAAALDMPAEGNAIHGLVRWLPFRAVEAAGDAIRLACVLHAQPAYPWRIELSIGYRLDADGLTVTSRATNIADAAAPFGIGFHPYLTVGTELVDQAVLTIPARRRLVTDGRGLPTDDEAVRPGPFDFSGARPIGGVALDAAYTGLVQDDDGRTRVTLEDPEGSRRLTLWMDASFRYVMAYTGDGVEQESRRRSAIALEPMTCPPDALRSGVDLIRLEPGGSWEGSWGIVAPT